MALIKCPECRKKISDTVAYCPKCGYSISTYLSLPDTFQKNKRNHITKYLIISAIILSIALILCAITQYVFFQNESTDTLKYQLNGDYITTANDILEKEINIILNGYAEDDDYSKITNEKYISYTFPVVDAYLGSNTELIIYTEPLATKIVKVEYTFRLENDVTSRSFVTHVFTGSFTNYYDVDPVYSYLDSNNKHITIDKSKFFSLDKKTSYYITWESSKGKAVYSCTNLYSEKREYGKLTFTKN